MVKAVDEAENLVFQIGQGRVTDTMVQMRDVLNVSLDRMEELFERGDSITGRRAATRTSTSFSRASRTTP